MQRGSGIGTIVSSIFRALVPWIRKGATALVKSAPAKRLAKRATKTALKAAGNFAGDVVSGKNVKNSAKVNIAQVQKGLEKALTKIADPPPKKQKRVIGSKVKRAPMPPPPASLID